MHVARWPSARAPLAGRAGCGRVRRGRQGWTLTDVFVERRRFQRHLRNFRFLVDGTGTGIVAFLVLVGLIATVALVVTLPLLPRVARAASGLAAIERHRVGRYLGFPIPGPPGGDDGSVWALLADPGMRRDLGWLALHAMVGTLAGVLALSSPLGVVQNFVIALIWPLVPDLKSTLNTPVTSWTQAAYTLLIAAGYAAIGPLLVPPLAHWYLRASASRLAPPEVSLVRRLADVVATRAAALDAHDAELQRIERDLHDGTQNRLVAVVMHLGMAERALRRDPTQALPAMITAQNAAIDALAELRGVVRSIYPPVLADRGLDGAVAALASHSSVPCVLDIEPLPRLPAPVAAAAYFTVAEALTNAAKHSGATEVTARLGVQDRWLVLEIRDDGHGGANEDRGTGLVGIRRRVCALDGAMEVYSPPGGPTVLRVDIPTGK